MSGGVLSVPGLEHVKNKDSIIHSHMSLPSRAMVVKKVAQSRRVRSSDAGFVKACDRESHARMRLVCREIADWRGAGRAHHAAQARSDLEIAA